MVWRGGKKLPRLPRFSMKCETCKQETNKLIAGNPMGCPACHYRQKDNSPGLKVAVYLDPKNGTRKFKTTSAEIQSLRDWKPREHRSQNGLGY